MGFHLHVLPSSPFNMSSSNHLTGFERFSVEPDFEDLMDILTKIQPAAVGSAAATNPAYTMQAAALTQDVSYIKKHAERLKTDDLNRSRIDELLNHLMDAAKPHLNFARNGSEIEEKNTEQLLCVVARLKVLVPRPRETTTTQVEGLGPVKKKDSPYTSTEEKSEAATAIVEAMAELEVAEWRMEGLRESYASLDLTQKLCLLCFSIFPRGHESLVVKKKIMIYWWVGEGFIEKRNTTIEEIGEEILNVLADKGFIEHVMVKGRVSGSCRMHPFVQSFVVVLAKRAGFLDFDNGEISSSFDLSQKACLVKLQDKPPSSSSQRWGRQAKTAGGLKQFETVQTLFNANVSVIHIGLEWFKKMKHLSVLRLGSWRSGDHIEVHDHKFLEELKSMRQLKLVSLQGMSTIFKLPDSVCKLTNLIILDLRKCHSLEKLPNDIGDLKNLTHLDLTMCHLLTKLPKGISYLPSLEVLKGFVVNEHARESTTTMTTQDHHNPCFFNLGRRKNKKEICVLRDLQKLENLRELSMVVYGDEFPNGDELEVLKKMRKLRKLKITWERSLKDKKKSDTSREINTDSEVRRGAALDQIEKLELWCLPWRKAPDWFAARQLKNLRRLYIKGGKLDDLPGGGEDDAWGVETLRLKYLPELVVSWDELVNTKFPKMAYLERSECNKLGLFPCDEDGVWRREIQKLR